MGFFSRGKSGGMMNVIRCDEEEYLVWKWRPIGQEANSTSRENSIRFGSSLRVKDGEVAVFVYNQKNGINQDFIIGPFDETIKTANFPVLANIMGFAFGGDSPFQAEVYFINLQGNNQLRFAVPYFDVFDPRLPDHGVPVAVRGTITFNVTDYKGFIKLNRLINFDLDAFKKQIKDAVSKYVKAVVTNIPRDSGIPLVQMETRIIDINDKIETSLKPRIEKDFGVNLKALDISAIDIDKESPYYNEMRELTAGNTARTMNAQTDVNIQNMKDIQSINAENMSETLRMQREEAQRAQRLQTESNYIGVHALDQQAEVLKTGAQNLGQMGTLNTGNGNGGMNAAGLMTGMMMGGAMGQQMAGMMNNMGQNMQNGFQQQPNMQNSFQQPPNMPNISYYIAVNGQQYGPYNFQQLIQMSQNGQFTSQTYVWKQGMSNWLMAENVEELKSIFAQPSGNMPPPPPM